MKLQELEQKYEELRKEIEENENFYLRQYAKKDSECLELQHKLNIATEALENLSFLDCEHCPKALNQKCYSSDDCKDVYRNYAQQVLEQIKSEE
ncbi:MAG: hypothetical protein KHX03_09830 [Clostridium sp.]|nr:hypothetical protein [Clostridium sp.]